MVASHPPTRLESSANRVTDPIRSGVSSFRPEREDASVLTPRKFELQQSRAARAHGSKKPCFLSTQPRPLKHPFRCARRPCQGQVGTKEIGVTRRFVQNCWGGRPHGIECQNWGCEQPRPEPSM